MEENRYPMEIDSYNNNSTNPVTLADVQTLADTCDSLMSKVSSTVGQVASTVIEIKSLTAQVELETARIEASLDTLLLKVQRDVKLYESSLPLLDKQFTLYQQRMDSLMGKAVDMIADDFSDTGIARHEAILKLIELTNDGLNRLMGKLIPQY